MKKILFLFPLLLLTACGSQSKINNNSNQTGNLPTIDNDISSGDVSVKAPSINSGDDVNEDTKEALKLINDLLK